MTRLWGKVDVHRSLLALVVLLGACLRLYGLWFRPPMEDEPFVVLRALKFGTGDLNPHNFDWPASLLMYLTFGALAAYFSVGRLLGVFSSAHDFGVGYFVDNSAFYLVARVLPAVMGVMTIYVVYLCARRFWDRHAALAAAAVFAFSPLAVIESHFALADTPLLLFVMLGLFFALRILEREGLLWDYIGAGVSVGLATSMKYNGGMAIVPALVAHVLLCRKRRSARQILLDRNLWLMAGSALGAFVVTCPFAVLDFPKFREDLAFLFRYQRRTEPHVGGGISGSPHWTIAVTLSGAMGAIPYLAGLVGVPLAIWKKRGRSLLILVFAAAYFLLNGQSKVLFARYSLPLVPHLSALAGATFSELVGLLPWPRWRDVSLAAVCVVVVAPQAISGLNYARELALPDTRTLCRRWVEENIPPGARIALEDAAIEILHTPASLERNHDEAVQDGMEGRARYFGNLIEYAAAINYPYKYDIFWIYDFTVTQDYLELLQEKSVQWFVYDPRKEKKFEEDATRRDYPDASRWRRAFYDDIRAGARLVHTIKPLPGKLRGPVLMIYSLAGGEKLSLTGGRG